MTRTSTWIVLLPPSRENWPSCSTCRSFACSGERQLADLVQEHRARVGRPRTCPACAGGARERAALVAEQLALEQLTGQRRAVDLHERPLPAWR